MSSRLALDAHGRRAVEITMPQLGASTATRYRVLGNGLEASTATEVGRFYFVLTTTQGLTQATRAQHSAATTTRRPLG